jgi:putative DNA primase/helicase
MTVFQKIYRESILDATHRYQKLDLEVVPTAYVKDGGGCSCSDGTNCHKPGKHPAALGWNSKYTSKDKTPSQVVWDRDQGIGIRTGSCNMFLVLDCDSREAYDRVIARFPGLKESRTAETFRGYQIYLKIPEETIIKSGTNVLDHIGISEVDVRAENGFVMAPPTRHPEGGQYRWLIEDKLECVPEDLLCALREGEKRGVRIASRVSSLSSRTTIKAGERHDTCNRLAVRYRSLGLDREDILDLLLSLHFENPEDDPISQEEIQDIVAWACERIAVDDTRKRLVKSLIAFHDYYSHIRWKGMGGGTDKSVLIALIQQGLLHGEFSDHDVEVPISQRTLASNSGITRTTLEKSLGRLYERGVVQKGKGLSGSRSASYLLDTSSIHTEPYATVGQMKSDEDTWGSPFSLSGTPLHKVIQPTLLDNPDFRWGKDRLGKTNAPYLSILLSHSQDSGKQEYKNQEVAEVLSDHYGEEIKSNGLSRFFERCSESGVLERAKEGCWRIPEDVQDRVAQYQEETGETLARAKQDGRNEEDRRRHWLRGALYSSGLHNAFENEALVYRRLSEDGTYEGTCSDAMRAFLARVLRDGEYVAEEAEKQWPTPTGVNENLKKEIRIKSFLNGEIDYGDLQVLDKPDARVIKHLESMSNNGVR